MIESFLCCFEDLPYALRCVSGIFCTVQGHLTNRQANLCRQYAFGCAFGQFPQQFVVTQLAVGIAAQYLFFKQRLDKVAEQALVEELRGIEAMLNGQALSHHGAQVFQFFGAQGVLTAVEQQ